MPDIKAQNETTLASVKAIYDAADEANTLLDGMKAAAQQAGTTLNGIYQDAMDAQTSADDAQASATQAGEYASRALGNLSTVQSVTETLNWITSHGTMTLTQDVVLDPSHVYFVADQNGDYVVGGQHYSVVTEPDVADISTYYELSIDESLNNYVATHLAVDSEGLWIIPDAGGNKVLIATGQGSTYTSAGTYIVDASAILARFTANGIILGDSTDGNYAVIDEDSFDIYHNTGASVIEMAHFGYDYADSSSKAPYFSFGIRIDVTDEYEEYDETKRYYRGDIVGTNIYSRYVCITDTPNPAGAFDSSYWSSMLRFKGKYSTAEGNSLANGDYSHAEGRGLAIGVCSHAEGGTNTTSTDGNVIYRPIARGNYSHAEGKGTMAIGDDAHAEGQNTIAKGQDSHAEGAGTQANGRYSHAEGLASRAKGEASHAQNLGTRALSDNQTALGKYNIEDANDVYAVIVGNGTAYTRSNAFTVDWSGNTEASGDITDGSGNVLSEKADASDYLPLTGGTLTGALNGTDINASENVVANDMLIDLPEYQTADTTDKAIYDALVALGWDSDVIV